MEEKLKRRLDEMLEKSADSGNLLVFCAHTPRGIKVLVDENLTWFNRADDFEIYDGLMNAYLVGGVDNRSRYSHTICSVHMKEELERSKYLEEEVETRMVGMLLTGLEKSSPGESRDGFLDEIQRVLPTVINPIYKESLQERLNFYRGKSKQSSQ